MRRRTKEELERETQEVRLVAATALAIAGCVLRVCSNHENVVLRVENGDMADVYKLGDRMFRAGELKAFFRSRRHMIDCIKAAVLQHQTRCELCEPPRPN